MGLQPIQGILPKAQLGRPDIKRPTEIESNQETINKIISGKRDRNENAKDFDRDKLIQENNLKPPILGEKGGANQETKNMIASNQNKINQLLHPKEGDETKVVHIQAKKEEKKANVEPEMHHESQMPEEEEDGDNKSRDENEGNHEDGKDLEQMQMPHFPKPGLELEEDEDDEYEGENLRETKKNNGNFFQNN